MKIARWGYHHRAQTASSFVTRRCYAQADCVIAPNGAQRAKAGCAQRAGAKLSADKLAALAGLGLEWAAEGGAAS
ncbi:hypothetical protein [Streptomyces tauricus]|uniref:hypothetical protein n=1 Tax=Streptomyces tauricus TaxID=68274 RepID=UPI0038301DC7